MFLERGDHTFVGTHDGRPYVGAVQRQHHRAVPGGRAHLHRLPLPRAPVGHRGRGLGLHALPRASATSSSPSATTPRCVRVLARDNARGRRRLALRQGPLRLPGDRTPRSGSRAPLVRDGGALREVSWERALDEAAAALEKAGARDGRARRRRRPPTRRASCVQRLLRDGLGSPHVDSRAGGVARRTRRRRACSHAPTSRRACRTSTTPTRCWWSSTELVDEAPILDLRVRKAVRRNGARLVTLVEPALARSTRTPPPRCASRPAPPRRRSPRWPRRSARRAPRSASTRWRASAPWRLPARARARTASAVAAPRAAQPRRCGEAGDVVVIWGERVSGGERGRAGGRRAAGARRRRSSSADRPESGLIEVPRPRTARGLREVGCLPGLGPGLADATCRDARRRDRRDGGDCGAAAAARRPARTTRARGVGGGARARRRRDRVRRLRTEALDAHADVVFPAESYAEKEGTVTHPDGRLQRVRQAIGHPGEVRPGWSVLAELCERLGAGAGVRSRAPTVTAELVAAVPFYARPDARGDRRPRRALAGARRRLGAGGRRRCPTAPLEEPPARARGADAGDARHRSGPAARSEHSPSLALPGADASTPSSAPRTPSGSASRRRRGRGERRPARACAPPRACARACPPAACSCSRARRGQRRRRCTNASPRDASVRSRAEPAASPRRPPDGDHARPDRARRS